MALTSVIDVGLTCTQTSALDLLTPTATLTLAKRVRLLTGTGAGQADLLFTDTRTLGASGTEDLDLAGSLAGAFGAQVFARVKAVYVEAAAGNTNNVNLTRPASNGAPLFLAAGDGVPVRPGGVFLWVASDATAVAVTAGTGDLLTLTNSSSGSSVTYSIVIIGSSA